MIDIQEKELEDIIRRSPEYIEEGLSFVDSQRRTERGPLDVLLVDSGNCLVIGELKVVEDDNMLSQCIDYYDYITRNLEGFARVYKQKEINIDPLQQPRLFLIAPSFSVTLLNRCKWIDIPISLFTYQSISFQDDTKEIVAVFREVTTPSQPKTIEVYSFEKHLKYITDNSARSNVQKLMEDIKKWDNDKIVISATKYDISLKVSNRLFAYISTRRKYFLIYTYDTDGNWKGFRIDSQADLDITLPITKANFEKFRK